jgi:hypothetical protein
VAGAVHDAEEGSPRADRIAILMCAFFREVRRAQVESLEGGQVLRAERSESIEQLFERLAAAFFFLCETVEGIERDGFTVFEDAFGTGHPIGALTDNEVSHDI